MLSTFNYCFLEENHPVSYNIHMKLYLDTSQSTIILKLDDKIYTKDFGRELAEKLLQFIKDQLQLNHQTWQDLTEITFMSGPGSFTGLRIGATVVNTLADQLKIPLFTHHGEKVSMIIPDYGRSARITQPKR